jgi:hypothetical protein
MQLFWFTAHPATYGSASSTFHVQCQGHGHTFSDAVEIGNDQANTMEIDLQKAVAYGEEVLAAFEKINTRYLSCRKKLLKRDMFSMRTRQSKDEEQMFPVSKDLSNDFIFRVLTSLDRKCDACQSLGHTV